MVASAAANVPAMTEADWARPDPRPSKTWTGLTSTQRTASGSSQEILLTQQRETQSWRLLRRRRALTGGLSASMQRTASGWSQDIRSWPNSLCCSKDDASPTCQQRTLL